MTSQWARWRLKSPASPLFTQPFIRAQIKENIKAPCHWPLCGEFVGDRWISRTNGQWRGKCFHLMTSSCQISNKQEIVAIVRSTWELHRQWCNTEINCDHDDVIKWKHFPRYWPSVREIHRSPMNCLHKGQWRGALMFCLICTWINDWVNNRETGDLGRHLTRYDVTVMNVVLEKEYACND